MYAIVSPQTIQLPPGAVVRLPATWQDYQDLSQQRGDRPIPRIKFREGEVLLMSPLAKHGRDASLIADIIKVLLDHSGQEYDSFTPVTMERPEKSGIEPDYCFYIEHWQDVSGKERINWATDPPPDLVLEIDVTSFSDVNDYLPYQVPEVWLYRNQQLSIYWLENNGYVLQDTSRFIATPRIHPLVERCMRIAYERNTSTAIRDLKEALKAD
ncbi:MAG: Uma2 family endonuclease [Leptolyngbyaceae bacterium]|nr:Uma2 family endonuclease [Leptolyngbyaceae bacterium]